MNKTVNKFMNKMFEFNLLVPVLYFQRRTQAWHLTPAGSCNWNFIMPLVDPMFTLDSPL